MAAQQRTAFPIPLTNFEAQRHSPTTNLNHPPRYALHQPSIRVPHQRPLKPTPSGKALPRKPQGWTRVCHETSLFLRSIGLGIFVSTLSGLFSRGFSEPAKVAVRRNRMTALLRSLVHAVPLGVALMEIILNWKGYYIGATFTKQAYYQFAAKAHEITIQASLTVMVLSYIRYALTVGRGLPFGSLIGGFQFLQLSYLWSTELWASITSKHFSLTRKLGLLLVAVVCSILAATVGPSSATLLIPRQVYWPLQPTRFAINGTFQNVWPDRLDGLNIPDECTVLRISESNSLCPAGDWPAFNALMGKSSQPRDWTFRNGPAPGPLTFHDPRMGFNNIITTELCASSDRNQICGSTPQSVIVEGAYLNNLNWTKSLAFNKTSNDDVFKINKGYYQPYAITSCASSTITESTREEMLRFPDVPETEAELSRGRVLVSVPGLTKGDLLQTPGNLTQFRLKWVDFPPRLFNDRLFGVVILHPEGSAANGTLNITTCTLGAGWGTSAIHVSTAAGGMFYSTMANTPKSWPVHDRRYINQDTGTLSLPDYANISGYVYPQRRIDISSHWARFLDPAIVGLGDYNTTALNSFMAIIDGPSGESASAYILNVMLTTGLARTGVEYGWQDISDSVTPCDACLVFELEHSVGGWAYTIQGNATKLSVTVMMTYCVLAFAHIIYLGMSGISSTAWDSIAEIVALAMNSSPTKHLQNTCAGVLGIKTFQTPVRIMVTNEGSGKDEHLELVFGDEEQGNAQMSRMEVNKKYGTLHTDRENQKGQSPTNADHEEGSKGDMYVW